jgi:hypothetical protein
MKHFRVMVAVGVAAFLLGSGASFLYAGNIAGWDDASASPPNGNVPAPINVGDDVNNVRQEKQGGLVIKKDFDVGGKAKLGNTLEVVGDAKLKDVEVVGKMKKSLTVEEGIKAGKDFEAGGKIKVGTTLDVGGAATFGGSISTPLIAVGPLSPSGGSGATVLMVGGKIQIRGGGPAAGYVLTANDDGTAKWEPAVSRIRGGTNVTVTPEGGTGEVIVSAVGGVTRLRAGSNISLTSETGDITVSASQSYVPGWVTSYAPNQIPVQDGNGNVRWESPPLSIPPPPGGGKVLVSNELGKMSWEDPPRVPEPSRSGTTCGSASRSIATAPFRATGCATNAGTCTGGAVPQTLFTTTNGTPLSISCVYP